MKISNKDEKLIIFGQYVKDQRVALNLTQEGLADSCGFDRTYISLIERGQRNMSLINIITLASGLQTTPSELIRIVD
mgnify:CR=1 FL=1